jgi:superfamily I DNA/RNA helicase
MNTREHRLFGPPGTGKTTALQHNIQSLVEHHGSDSIVVCSFSKAAATELVSRDLPIDDSRVGTLHALCYRALGKPTIAETKLDDWNDFAPEYRLQSSGTTQVDDPLMGDEGTSGTEADKVFADYMLLRARAVDRALWPPQVEAFARKWEFWTGNSGFVDFQGMIDLGMRDLDRCPGDPQILIVDEAQDSSASELLLLRKWEEQTDYTILALDDDQCVYSFRGASPEALLSVEIPKDNLRILRQSYRVPETVRVVANRWIEQVAGRQPKEYISRKDATGAVVQGECRFLPTANYKNAEGLLNDAEQYLEQGKSVMFLTTCGYQLDPLKAVLRKRGVPFANPYKKNRADWNPLAGREGAVGAKDRLLSYLSPMLSARPWNPAECDQWFDVLASKGVLNHGAKALLHAAQEEKRGLTDEEVMGLFEGDEFTNAFGGVLDPQLQWLENHLLPSKARAMEFPMSIYRRGGLELLQKKPQITIGTIHSVKGGEADVIYLMPDLSLSSMQQWSQYGAGRDAIVRQFYVGMTRARESLIMTAPATSSYAEIWGDI